MEGEDTLADSEIWNQSLPSIRSLSTQFPKLSHSGKLLSEKGLKVYVMGVMMGQG